MVYFNSITSVVGYLSISRWAQLSNLNIYLSVFKSKVSKKGGGEIEATETEGRTLQLRKWALEITSKQK